MSGEFGMEFVSQVVLEISIPKNEVCTLIGNSK